MHPRITSALFAIVLVAVCFSTLPRGQAQNQAGKPADRQIVTLNVRVTNEAGHSVSDVTQEEFRVMEDGVPQTLTFYSRDDIPLTYALVIDCSGSLRPQFSSVIATAARVVDNNQPDDQTELIRFISSNKIETVHDFTSDKETILRGLMSLYVEGGQSAVIDAVYVAAQSIVKRAADEKERRRHVMILVTDGEDRMSYYKEAQLFRFLGEHDVEVFVIGLVKDLTKTKAKAVSLLTRLATETGGRVFLPSSMDQLANIAKEIVRDIRVQYLVGYVPTNSDASFHKVQVSVVEKAGSEKRTAITRIGYSVPHN